MKTKYFLLFTLLVTLHTVKAAPPEEGRSIFMTRCAACHNLNKALTGPALAGVHERRSMEWITKFVHSSQTLIKSGDTAAISVFEKFNKIMMPDHTDLTEENIRSIVDYIKSESKSVTVEKAPFAKPGQQKTYYLPISINNYVFFAGYLLVVIALVVTLYLTVQWKTYKLGKSAEKKPA